jgi:23S rRNA (uracil1939-C5)-methyltransferase
MSKIFDFAIIFRKICRKTYMPINSRLGKKMDLKIDRLGINGEGVSKWYGCTIFVDGALPNEEVHCSLYEKKKNFGRARVLHHLSFSEHRVAPVCPLFGTCGGCQLMHLSYPEQLKAKRERVVDALERIGKFKDVQVEECEPSKAPFFYRNKIQIPLAHSSQGIRLGLYARNSHDLIDMNRCYIHCELGDKIYTQLKELILASELTAFDCITSKGELKHLLIKTAVSTSQALVIFVSTIRPSHELQDLAHKIMRLIPEVKGVIHNYNPQFDNVVLGEEYTTLAGDEAIEDVICDLRFKVSPASFFQVNPHQAEKLYTAALHAANLDSNDIVLDAYCGVGGMSLLFAKHCKYVLGVEYVSEAIDDAKLNANLNSINNAMFFAAAVEDYLVQTDQHFDVAILNPPRKGCDPNVLYSLVQRSLKKIIYVSCDPATLARDLHILSQHGWKIDFVRPFDMFPQTSHVESLVVLTKEKD